jgi:hypothetical protein
MSQDEALLDSGLGARKSYVLWQARNGQLCSSFAVMEGLRPAKPYESRVCNCFVFSTEIATFEADSGFRARCGSSRFQNGSRGREDAGCSVVGDFLFGSQQVYRLRRDGLSPDGKLIQYA